jgi:arylsulfatase
MNLIFVAIDTLRADHLSCYGYPHTTSPVIDSIAEKGALFENFYAVGNSTHPGFTTLLTGMHPESTGIVSHWSQMDLKPGIPVFAEYFKRQGYHTYAVDNLYDGWKPAGHRYYEWFRRGYDAYDYPRVSKGFFQQSADCVQLLCQWLDKEIKQPFAVFLHLWNPHAPYNKAPQEFYRFYLGNDPCDLRMNCMPETIRAAQQRTFGMPITDPSYVVAAYDAEIAYTDSSLKMLFEKLEELDLIKDTVILVTSDHGEIMDNPRLAAGRPWAFCHIGLHEDVLRVPLIISGVPAIEGLRIKGVFQLVDILPTLIELFNLETEMDLDGISLKNALRGEQVSGRSRIIVSENTYQKQRAILEPPWKCMRFEDQWDSMPRKSLYNLEDDPKEEVNLVDLLPETAASLNEKLDVCIDEVTRGAGDPLKEQPITHPITPE